MKTQLTEQGSVIDRIRKGEIKPDGGNDQEKTIPSSDDQKKKQQDPELEKKKKRKQQEDIPQVNPVNRVGKLTYSSRAAKDQINPLLIQDLKKAVMAAKIGDVQITYASTGHGGGRHSGGWAVDISMLNGKGYGGGSNTEFTILGNILVRELKKLGYKFGEIKGAEERAYLWQTMTGGDHYNHVHVSNTIGRKSKKEQPSEIKIHKVIATYKNDLYDMLILNPGKYFSKFRGWILGDDEEKAYQYFVKAINTRKKQLKIDTLYNSKHISKWDKQNLDNLKYITDVTGQRIRTEITAIARIGDTLTIPWYYPNLKTGKWYQREIEFEWDYL